MSQQSDKIAAIVKLCNEIAQSVEQMEGKQVNPALLSAVFDVLRQARVLVDDDNESKAKATMSAKFNHVMVELLASASDSADRAYYRRAHGARRERQ